MEAVTAYLGLGSNLGRRVDNLAQAVRLLEETPAAPGGGASPPSGAPGAIEIIRASSVYETAPWGYADQPHYLNCVLEVATTLSPEPLLERAKDLEQRLGREAGIRFGPRVIDVDILLYGDLVLDLPHLQIPHPRMTLRAFVLVPMAELNSALVHPVCATTMGELASRVEDAQEVKLWGAAGRLHQQ